MTACPMCGHDPARAVSARWEFVLDKRIESANNRTVNAGASRWRYAKQRDDWGWLVKIAALSITRSGLIMARSSVKRRVTITRRYAGRCRLLDKDNLGVKPLVDALVLEGIARDDDAVHLELHVLQVKSERNETHVLVEELA